MELLTRTYRTVRRLLTPNGWLTFGVVLFLLALEVVGRYYTSTDLHDAFIACLLGGLIAYVCYRHRTTPLPWAARLARTGARCYQSAKAMTFELVIDMRGPPGTKRGY